MISIKLNSNSAVEQSPRLFLGGFQPPRGQSVQGLDGHLMQLLLEELPGPRNGLLDLPHPQVVLLSRLRRRRSWADVLQFAEVEACVGPFLADDDPRPLHHRARVANLIR